jgi:hypothetical protein
MNEMSCKVKKDRNWSDRDKGGRPLVNGSEETDS